MNIGINRRIYTPAYWSPDCYFLVVKISTLVHWYTGSHHWTLLFLEQLLCQFLAFFNVLHDISKYDERHAVHKPFSINRLSWFLSYLQHAPRQKNDSWKIITAFNDRHLPHAVMFETICNFSMIGDVLWQTEADFTTMQA